MNILVSACLLGAACRYDGASKPNEKILSMLKNPVFNLIPVCPEILGGLPTPRPPCEISDGRVVTQSGENKTVEYERGADEVLRLAKLFNCRLAILNLAAAAAVLGRPPTFYVVYLQDPCQLLTVYIKKAE